MPFRLVQIGFGEESVNSVWHGVSGGDLHGVGVAGHDLEPDGIGVWNKNRGALGRAGGVAAIDLIEAVSGSDVFDGGAPTAVVQSSRSGGPALAERVEHKKHAAG